MYLPGRGRDIGADPGTQYRAGRVHPAADYATHRHPRVRQLNQLCGAGTGEEHAFWRHPATVPQAGYAATQNRLMELYSQGSDHS